MRLAVMITTRVGKTTRLCAETMQVSEAHKEGSSDDCMADDRNRYVMSLSSLALEMSAYTDVRKVRNDGPS